MSALRASAQGLDLDAALGDASEAQVGVEGEAPLRSFALAVLARDAAGVADAAAGLADALGSRAVADAGGVVARFNGINRVADATGTRFDPDSAPEAARRWSAGRRHDPAKRGR